MTLIRRYGTTLLLLCALPGLAQAQLYFSEDSNGNGLYMLDTATGAATNVGISGVTSSTVGLAPSASPAVLFGTQYFQLLEIQADGSGSAVIGGDGQEGLAFDPATGTLYGAINGSFRTVDPVTGVNQTPLAAPPGDMEGIAWGNGGVYAIAGGAANLYFYDPGTDSWATIGSTGITWDQAGLAYDPGTNTLYAKGDQDSNLYRVDPATGAATVIGDTGIVEGGGLAFVGPGPGPGPAPAPGPTAIPTLSVWSLLLLAGILLTVAVSRLAHQRR